MQLKNNEGVVAIEAAFIIPLIMLAMFVVIEFGLYFMKEQIVIRTVNIAAHALQTNPEDARIYANAQQSGTALVDFSNSGNFVCAQSYPELSQALARPCSAGTWSTGRPVLTPAGRPYFIVVKAFAGHQMLTPVPFSLGPLEHSVVIQTSVTADVPDCSKGINTLKYDKSQNKFVCKKMRAYQAGDLFSKGFRGVRQIKCVDPLNPSNPDQVATSCLVTTNNGETICLSTVSVSGDSCIVNQSGAYPCTSSSPGASHWVVQLNCLAFD